MGPGFVGEIDLAQQARPAVTSQAYHHNAQPLLHHHLHGNPQKKNFCCGLLRQFLSSEILVALF
jgi:hypothetical protein